MENYKDHNIIKAIEWLKSHLHTDAWPSRLQSVEDAVTSLTRPREEDVADLKNMKTLKVENDQIGWYIYLMECLTKDISKYEAYQGARVGPIFQRIGADLELVKEIGGIDTKVRKMLKSEKNQADSNLFEILTALLWVKNGWEVSFIDVTSHKTPDIKAVKNGKQYYVECKRMAQRSEYSKKEQKAWLAMLNHVSPLLMENALMLEVVFHKEVHTIPETYLLDLFGGNTGAEEGKLHISNDTLTVSLAKIDLKRINAQLKRGPLQEGSPFMRQLIGGNAESTGFTAALLAKHGYYGPPAGFNRYILNVAGGYAIDWRCDAPESIEAKARDLFHHIKEANDQLPPGSNAVIHVGVETLDGPEVERARFEKIKARAADFDKGGSGLKMIYCHFFQSYALPGIHLTFDETTAGFLERQEQYPILDQTFLVVDEAVKCKNDVHWEREHP
ncbi:hypothetical protein ACLI09_01915 [Flavobacterium sp. RHBU_24]|uniref:hypothetical protein n=1 Tax=Flavobacterium sp. RHBU_24 TaxID=3391185 RepID=UPI00398532C3